MSKNFTYVQIRNHMKQQDEIEDFLAKKGREYDALTENKLPKTASFESFRWYPESKSVSITYYETWRYGGYENYTISLPFNAIEQDMEIAAKEANAAREMKAAQQAKAREDAAERREKAELRRLQEKYA